jgi:peptidoglycan/xylan/chitin deacetylase (PgdA/CDA1 family)
MAPLPVLVYHSVHDDPPEWIAPYAVARRAFAEQLDAVLASGRTPVTAGQVVAARTGGPRLPEHAVAITFDDGFHDFVDHAWPELEHRSLPVTLFVTTGALRPLNHGLLPAADMLTVEDVAKLDRAGVRIGAHSHLHPQMDTLDEKAVAQELSRPKEILEKVLGREVDLFAYPHGYSSRRVRELVRRLGYRGAFGVGNAFSPDDDDPFRIARLMVMADTGPAAFEAWLRGAGAPVAPARERVRTTVWRFYRRRRVRLRVRPRGGA